MVRKILFFLDFDRHIGLALTIPTFRLIPHKSSYGIVCVGQAYEQLDVAHMLLPQLGISVMNTTRLRQIGNRPQQTPIAFAMLITFFYFEPSSDDEENGCLYTLNWCIRIYK